MATLTSLPNELASQVCELLEDDRDDRDLWSFCQVSKWCLGQGRPLLYEAIALWSQRIPSFLRTIIVNPELGHLVRFLRFSSFESCTINERDMEFFQKHFVGTGTHADFFWANIIADPSNLIGILIESLLLKLINLEQMDMFINTDPNFMLLSSIGASSKTELPASLKAIDLMGEDGTGNLGVLHGILAASKVETVTAEFIGAIHGLPEDVSRYDFLLNVQLLGCKLKKQELQRFLQKCSSLRSFCYIGDGALNYFPDECLLSRFKHAQITAKDVVEALTFNASTLRDLHIHTSVKYVPIEDLRSFTSLERLRIARGELALSFQDRYDDDDDDDSMVEDDDSMVEDQSGEDDDNDNDNAKKDGSLHLGCDPFLEKLPSSLRLLRIDKAGNALLNELITVSTDLHGILPNLEKIELQSHDQLLLTAAVKAVQGSGVVIELVGCSNYCWNCDIGSPPFCKSCRSQL